MIKYTWQWMPGDGFRRGEDGTGFRWEPLVMVISDDLAGQPDETCWRQAYDVSRAITTGQLVRTYLLSRLAGTPLAYLRAATPGRFYSPEEARRWADRVNARLESGEIAPAH